LNHLDETNLKEHQLQNQLKQQIIENTNRNVLLEESEAHYKSLFSLSPSPKLVFDAETLQFLQVNDAAINVYGFCALEFEHLKLNDLKADRDPTDLIESFLLNLKASQNIRFITKHRRKTGEIFPVELFCNYFPFKGREAILFIANDITELIKHTKEIEQQNKQLMEIAFMQSHIVRAPLARLLGLVMLLKSADTTSVDNDIILDYLFTSANELDAVIKNISEKISPEQNTGKNNFT
jgi:PAS domain S-box-containing protein